MALGLNTISAGTIGGTSASSYVTLINNNFIAIDTAFDTVLTDVEVATPTAGQVLSFNGVTSKWNNKSLADADIADKTTADAHYAKEVDETDTDTTKDKHISNSLAKSYSDHIISTSNPHTVTASQVGNTTAQWNANQIQGVTVDDASKSGGRVLSFNAGSGNLEYVDLTTSFIDLTDVDESSFTGKAGYFVKVNSTPDGLEFTNVIDGGDSAG